ncbi:MAG: flagellar M-ring protein FliF C-terminal domain-containing protein [Bacillota bacterium]|jgi:flagellar M-ring protein FliF|nr:flagellar M-ring protein FliF C-terminal domain-containing protein [Bacillota bacterium]
MAERLKQIPKQLLEIWNKYTAKQKTILISVISAIFIAFLVLVYVTNKVEYEELTITETTKEASEVIELLKSEGIKYKLGSDRLTVSVDLKRYSDAVLLLASNDMPSTGLSLDELLNNSLSTTNSDRNLKLNLYLQNQLKKYIESMEGVQDAEVYYIPVDDSNSILTTQRETSASVLLKVDKNFKPETAETIAEVVAAVIGNSTTDNIKVADQNGNLHFGGAKDLYTGNASSKEEYREMLRNTFINNLYMGLIKRGFDDVVIMPNLSLDFKKVQELYTEYLPAEGQDQGVYSHSYTYNSENAGSYGAGVPGTSSNDETDYMIEDSSNTSGNVKIEEFDYLPNERVTNIEYEVGAIIPEESSVSILLRKIVTRTEEDLESEGLLDEMSFDEYVRLNSEGRKLELDPDIVSMVSMATGISENNIQITAIEQPVYVPKVIEYREWTDYLQIILAVLIVALLLFVVIKALKPVEVTELEPELSVEELLATTKEAQPIDDIEFNEVSEVRKVIEKFVDEKPDAVAQLLRNWLNEDWE